MNKNNRSKVDTQPHIAFWSTIEATFKNSSKLPEVIKKLYRLPNEYFTSKEPGDIVSKVREIAASVLNETEEKKDAFNDTEVKDESYGSTPGNDWFGATRCPLTEQESHCDAFIHCVKKTAHQQIAVWNDLDQLNTEEQLKLFSQWDDPENFNQPCPGHFDENLERKSTKENKTAFDDPWMRCVLGRDVTLVEFLSRLAVVAQYVGMDDSPFSQTLKFSFHAIERDFLVPVMICYLFWSTRSSCIDFYVEMCDKMRARAYWYKHMGVKLDAEGKKHIVNVAIGLSTERWSLAAKLKAYQSDHERNTDKS